MSESEQELVELLTPIFTEIISKLNILYMFFVVIDIEKSEV